MPLPTLVRGQWTNRGNTALFTHIWTNNGTLPDYLGGTGQEVNELKAATGHQSNMLNPWIGAAYRYDTDEMFVLGPGGDQDGASNESYRITVQADTSQRDHDPTLNLIAFNFGSGNPSHTLPVGNLRFYYQDVSGLYGPVNNLWPQSGHTYCQDVHQPGTDQIWILPRAAWQADVQQQIGPSGIGQPRPLFAYNTTTRLYTLNDSMPTLFIGTNVVWDTNANRLLAVSDIGLYEFVPTRPAGSRWALLISLNDTTIQYRTSFFDAKRNWLVMAGAFVTSPFTTGIRYFNLSSLSSTPTVLPGAGGTIGTVANPGFDKDIARDRYMVYNGGASVFFVNPGTGAISTETGTGDTPPQLAQQTAGGTCFTRVRYSQNLDAVVSLQDFFTGVSIYRTSASPLTTPLIAFTDLTQGPRSGNTDTSLGQTSGVDGAIVTIYGQNLFDANGGYSLTIGGAAPAAVYYAGTASSAQSPANLINGYFNLQMIIAQVSHNATVGAGSIVVTADGQASNSYPFTVTVTGNIYYAAAGGGGGGTFGNPFASIQAGISAMVASNAPGDTLYVRNGLSTPSIDTTALSASTPNAIVVYPGATCTLGSSVSDPITAGQGGFTQNRTFAKFSMTGSAISGAQVCTIGDNSRVVGCFFTNPRGNGKSGTLGVFGSNVSVFGCEFTNCGNGPPTDPDYHVLYRYGRRSQPTAFPEMGCEIGYNYFHDNNACRAINCFNANVGGPPNNFDNPIGDHRIHHNVVVNQQWAGIGQQAGVVGTNVVHDNLLVNCGRATAETVPGNPQAVGIQLNCSTTNGVSAPGPITVNCYGNTIVNAGDVLGNDRGAFEIANAANYTLTLKNNIVYQNNGIQFISNNSNLGSTQNATLYSNNLWFGSFAAPAFDTSPITADPKFVSGTDFHLQQTSPAITAGASLGAGVDLAGKNRPTSNPWDLGVYQAGLVAGVSAPVLVALSPASCLPGAATFTLTIFADPGFPFTTGAQIFWDGAPRTTTLVNSQQCTITVPAADVAVAGAHLVTATNVGSPGSNALQFNVSLGPVTMSLSWLGKLRDRVGQGPTSLAADGLFDACIQATLSGLSGRTITALAWDNLTVNGQWNTAGGPFIFVCGAALTLDSAYLNNPVTMAVNFAVADGGTFINFLSDTTPPTEFAVGSQLRLTMSISDGSTVQATVTVTTTTPTLTQLVPNTMTIGSPAFVLNCSGTNFVTGCTVRWNGNSRATTFVSSTLVQATVLATDLLAPPQTALVTVQNPDSSLTNALPFTTMFAQQTGIFVGVVM